MPRVAQAPPPGVFRGATAESTPGRWYDANNIRFRGGQLQPIGGNALLPGSATATLPRDIISWHDNNKVRWCVIGTDSKLYAFRFDTHTLTDITPVGVGSLSPPGGLVGWGLADFGEDTYGTQRDPVDIGPQDVAAIQGDMWSLCTWGQDLLFVPTQGGHLYHWSPATPATLPTIVANAPYPNRGVAVTDQRHAVLFGAGGDPRSIAWSDQEDYNTWIAAVGNLAGNKQLATQSYAMCAYKVGAGLLIFTANDLHLMQYVGPPYAYGINQVASGCGPISLRAPVVVGTMVIWPGLQSFWQYSGNVQPVPCSVQDWFFSNINRQMVGRVFGSPNPSFSETWWDWPDEGSQECSRYLALNFADQARPWTIGLRHRTAADPTGTMDYPVVGGPSGSGGGLFLHEYGWLDNGVARASNGLIYAESGNITLGEGDKRYHVKQIVTDDCASLGDQDIAFQFYVREQPNGAEWSTGLYGESHDGLIDVRFSGRSTRMRLQPMDDGPFSIGRPRLEMRPGGRR